MTGQPPSLGRAAYEAYSRRVGHVSVAGVRLPSWDEQREDLREAWESAARAAIRAWGGSPGMRPQ